MKVSSTAAARYYPEKRAVALFLNREDIPNIEKLFVYKQRKDEKDSGDSFIKYEIEVVAREVTFKQRNTVWALLRLMYVSMNGEPPSNHDQLYDLYLDVLDLYANKKPNRFTGALRPVHLSESDVYDGANLIGHIMNTITEFCDLDMSVGSQVRDLFWKWQSWRGTLAKDPFDYDEDGNLLSVAAWTEKHKVSDASGIGGYLENAHIVSRGANVRAIEDVRNLIRLSALEHREMHQHGWESFLQKWPHLKGRVLMARQLFGGA